MILHRYLTGSNISVDKPFNTQNANSKLTSTSPYSLRGSQLTALLIQSVPTSPASSTQIPSPMHITASQLYVLPYQPCKKLNRHAINLSSPSYNQFFKRKTRLSLMLDLYILRTHLLITLVLIVISPIIVIVISLVLVAKAQILQ